MVNDWNLYKHIDGDCIPPSRDPFWINANEVPLPDYEAGNDVPNEVGPMEVTTILGERIEPKWKPPRVVQLGPLWADVDGADLVARGLGRVCREVLLAADDRDGVRGGQGARGHVARDLQVTIEPSRLAITIGARRPFFDEELAMKIYVGSNADAETSIWEVQDKRVVVFHLVKWHRLHAGNVRDSSRTWWRQCFVREEEPLTTHHTATTTTRRTIGENLVSAVRSARTRDTDVGSRRAFRTGFAHTFVALVQVRCGVGE